MKKILIESEKEYREYVFKILSINNGEKRFYDEFVYVGMDKERIKRIEKGISEVQEKISFGNLTDDDWDYHKEKSSILFDRRWNFDSIGKIDNSVLEDAFGVLKAHDCYYEDDDGNDIDEDGQIIPDDYSSPELLVFENYIKELSYPIMILQLIDSSWDRLGDASICIVEIVEHKEFDV